MSDYLTPEQIAEKFPMSATWWRRELNAGRAEGSNLGGKGVAARWYMTEEQARARIAAGSNSVRRRRRRAA